MDLDALEQRANRALRDTYGPMLDSDLAAFWTQKGIEGMRLAVAEADVDPRVVELVDAAYAYIFNTSHFPGTNQDDMFPGNHRARLQAAANSLDNSPSTS